MDTALVLGIIEVATKYGIPATIAAINALGKATITQEDIDRLPTLIKRPEDYE